MVHDPVEQGQIEFISQFIQLYSFFVGCRGNKIKLKDMQFFHVKRDLITLIICLIILKVLGINFAIYL